MRGKLRWNPYSPNEKAQREKAQRRAMASLKERLKHLAAVHPSVEFLFYARPSSRQNVLHVSQGLHNLDKSRTLTIIHNALDEFTKAPPAGTGGITAVERFDNPSLLTPSFSNAFQWFKETQSAKSLKPIYSRLKQFTTMRDPGVACNAELYLDLLKPLFEETSLFPVLQLWNAMKSFSYRKSNGVLGTKLVEVSKKHYVGLMQAFDLLAVARDEPPLPVNIDFAGNPIVPRVFIVDLD